MTQEAKTEEQRLKEAYDGLLSGEGLVGDGRLVIIDLVRRVEKLEADAKVPPGFGFGKIRL